MAPEAAEPTLTPDAPEAPGGRDAEADPEVAVRPVAFGPLDGAPASPRAADAPLAPLDFLLDVQVPIVVELGHTEICLEDLLTLKPGAVLELDKLANEPVELLIRDHPVAQGEVVVVDDHFGIRITQILDPADRVRNL